MKYTLWIAWLFFCIAAFTDSTNFIAAGLAWVCVYFINKETK